MGNTSSSSFGTCPFLSSTNLSTSNSTNWSFPMRLNSWRIQTQLWWSWSKLRRFTRRWMLRVLQLHRQKWGVEFVCRFWTGRSSRTPVRTSFSWWLVKLQIDFEQWGCVESRIHHILSRLSWFLISLDSFCWKISEWSNQASRRAVGHHADWTRKIMYLCPAGTSDFGTSA